MGGLFVSHPPPRRIFGGRLWRLDETVLHSKSEVSNRAQTERHNKLHILDYFLAVIKKLYYFQKWLTILCLVRTNLEEKHSSRVDMDAVIRFEHMFSNYMRISFLQAVESLLFRKRISVTKGLFTPSMNLMQQ